MQSKPVKIGHWGGNGGSPRDISQTPSRLIGVNIRSGNAIDAISFTYVNSKGENHSSNTWGGTGGSLDTVREIVFFLSVSFNLSPIQYRTSF